MMRKLIAIAALGIALTGFAVAPATAQSARSIDPELLRSPGLSTTPPTVFAAPPPPPQSIGQDAVLAACSGASASPDACSAAVAAFVASVRTLPAGQKDAQLSALVIALANSGSPATQLMVAAAIQTVANDITDTTRQTAAFQIAQAVSAGDELDGISVQALGSAN